MYAKFIPAGEQHPRLAQVFNIYAVKNGEASAVIVADTPAHLMADYLGKKPLPAVMPHHVQGLLVEVPVAHETLLYMAEKTLSNSINSSVLDLTPAGLEKMKKLYREFTRR